MSTSGDAAQPSTEIVDSRGHPISWEVANALNEARRKIGPATAADLVWRQLFTDVDRQRLGGNLEACWPRLGTIRMWMQARGVSIERSIIEVAQGLGFLDEAKADRLLRAVGEEEQAARIPERPFWDSTQGHLRLAESTIRHVRVMNHPSNIQLILDAFQSAGWRPQIRNPHGDDQHQLHLTLQSLNRGLEAIRFHAQEGGRAVTWANLNS